MRDTSFLRTGIIHTRILDPVDNVCGQELREIIQMSGVSVAHVIMQPQAASLFHKHHTMWEIYYILSGEGVFSQDDKLILAAKGSTIVLPPGSTHKLKNIGSKTLEHLVFAIPPFDPADIEMVEDTNMPRETIIPFRKRPKPSFLAKDGGIVAELLTKDEQEQTQISLAEGYLPPKRKANVHYHDKGEELYYVVSGAGKIVLDGVDMEIKKDDMVHIEKGDLHGLENTTKKDIEIICLCTPPYRDDDFLLPEDFYGKK